MASEMVLHAGARVVSIEELATIEAPEPTKTWFPVRHLDVLNTACELLNDADFRINKLCVATAHDNHRMFATLDLRSEIQPGVCLSVGVRSSTDQSFPLSLVAGSRVFICDNLAFFGDIKVNSKHTRHGSRRWQEGIVGAISELDVFVAGERRRIEWMRSTRLDDPTVHHLIFTAMRTEMVNHVQALAIADEWYDPRHEEFLPRTAWSLMNAFTEILKPTQVRNFNRFALATSKLYPLLETMGRN